MSKPRLGESRFFARTDGSIAHTVINSVDSEGNVGLLESTSRKPHVTYQDAVRDARVLLKAEKKKLQGALKTLDKKLKAVNTAAYKKRVLAAPLKHVSGSMAAAAFGLDGEVQNVKAPASYIEPGTQVFCVITPKTHNMMSPHYRPYDYFVLESRLKEAHLQLNGAVSYRIDSHYAPRVGVYTDLDEAKRELVRVFGQETGGTLSIKKVRVVMQKEEKRVEKLQTDRIIKSVNAQLGIKKNRARA